MLITSNAIPRLSLYRIQGVVETRRLTRILTFGYHFDMSDATPDLVTTAEAAEILGTGVQAVRHLRRRGVLPAWRSPNPKLGYRFLRSDVEARVRFEPCGHGSDSEQREVETTSA